MFVPSLRGFLYYILFIDDFSRKTWIYFLKCKESKEILKRSKQFKTLTENLSRHESKTLRTDNGGEYTSYLFKDFCKEAGIKVYIVPYNPQQNRVAKRKNKTTIEAARAMILDQNLEYYFWAKASCTICLYSKQKSSLSS